MQVATFVTLPPSQLWPNAAVGRVLFRSKVGKLLALGLRNIKDGYNLKGGDGDFLFFCKLFLPVLVLYKLQPLLFSTLRNHGLTLLLWSGL